MGFVEFFLQIPIFEKFCGINFCECLSLKNFAGLIFAKRGEVRKKEVSQKFISQDFIRH